MMVLFQRHQRVVPAGQLQDQRGIQRLHKAHIHQGGVEFVRYRRGFQQGAEVEDRHFLALRFTTPLPIGSDASGSSVAPVPRSARVAHRRAVVVVVAGTASGIRSRRSAS
jgi:hypothetical protein